MAFPMQLSLCGQTPNNYGNTIVNNVTQALGNTMDLGMEDLIEDSGPTPPPEEPPPVDEPT